MKKRYVVANWKSHPETLHEADELFDSLKKKLSRTKRASVVLCPPDVFLGALVPMYGGSSLRFGGQDCSTQEKGSHTGELLASTLKRFGANYVLVGHSERRALGDTNTVVSAKTKRALSAGLIPILCVGEKTRDDHGRYLQWLEEEIQESLKGVSKQKISKIILAYEPIWAIGKNAKDAMNQHELHQMIIFLKKALVKKYGHIAGLKVPVLYGGSVEPSNAEDLFGSGDVDGFLVGHASLVAGDFSEIVKVVDRA